MQSINVNLDHLLTEEQLIERDKMQKAVSSAVQNYLQGIYSQTELDLNIWWQCGNV